MAIGKPTKYLTLIALLVNFVEIITALIIAKLAI
jgi:hypothetical protein